MAINAVPHQADAVQGREATRGAALGFFVDCFDIYLPVIALGPASAFFFPPTMTTATKAVLDATIFIATLLGRPIGAFVFGQMADRKGRKYTTLFSVIGFGCGTAAMALLPGYTSWGIGAAISLIALRFISGVFMGGEYTAAVPLAMENAPKQRRGLYGGFITFAFPIAYIAISLVTLLALSFAPAGGPDAPYSRWGWRIVFIVGALGAFLFAWYYRRSVAESEVWRSSSATPRSNPLRVLFSNTHRRVFLQVLVVMLGAWFATNVVTAMLPSQLRASGTLTASSLTWILIVAEAAVAVAFPLLGALSQRIGRRPFLIGSGVITVLAPSAAFILLAGGRVTGFTGTALLAIVISVGGLCCYGATASYLTERFPVSIRASGYGLGYSLALIIPAFYPYMQRGLSLLVPSAFTPVIFLVLGGVLLVVGAAWGPETRHVDM